MTAGEEKSARTNLASRKIMDAEVVLREKKTARLRAMRMEQEAIDEAARLAAPKPEPKPKRSRAKKSPA